MAVFPITSFDRIRIDNRVATLSGKQDAYIWVSPLNGSVVQNVLYGYAILGFSNGAGDTATRVMKTLPVYDFQTWYHVFQGFGGALPAGFGTLLWSCYFVPRRINYTLNTFNIS